MIIIVQKTLSAQPPNQILRNLNSNRMFSTYRVFLRGLALVILLLFFTNTVFAGNSTFYDGTSVCPLTCPLTISSSTNWTVYHSLDRLNLCKNLIILDFAVYTPLSDDTKTKTIFGCSTSISDSLPPSNGNPASADGNFATQTSGGNFDNAELQVAWSGQPLAGAKRQAVGTQALASIAKFQSTFKGISITDKSTLFILNGDIVVAAHIGSRFNQDAASRVMQRFVDYTGKRGVGEATLMQICGLDRAADLTIGIVAHMGNSSLKSAQNMVSKWANGTCTMDFDASNSLGNISLALMPLTSSPSTKPSLFRRADCRSITVVSGDSCGSLATKCGISPADFTKFNPNPTLCSTLGVGQHVCCSAGTLPDLTPKPNSDGSCATLVVASGNTCYGIAASHSLTVDKLESFNKNTWG